MIYKFHNKKKKKYILVYHKCLSVIQFFSIANTQFMKQFTIFSQLTQSQNYTPTCANFKHPGQS